MSGCDGGLNLSVMAGLLVAWVSTFTIEIAVMLSKMSHGVLGVLRTDLALAKVCLLELGHNQTVCDNIKLYPDIQVNNIGFPPQNVWLQQDLKELQCLSIPSFGPNLYEALNLHSVFYLRALKALSSLS